MNEHSPKQHYEPRGPANEVPYKSFVSRFTDATSNIWAENRVLRFMAVCVLAASFVLGYLVLAAMNKQKTIIVPFGQGVEHLYLVGDEPSDAYLVAIARNVIQLVGTYTSSGIEFQLDEVLKLVHPRIHAEKREIFRRDVARLKDFREISFATYIRYDEEFSFGIGVIEIPVRRERFVGKSRTSDSGYYRLDYVVEEGRFWLTDIKFQRKGEVTNEQVAS